jgi:hypothetical protein
VRRKNRTTAGTPLPRPLRASVAASFLPPAALLLSACSTPEPPPAISPDRIVAPPSVVSATVAPSVSAAPIEPDPHEIEGGIGVVKPRPAELPAGSLAAAGDARAEKAKPCRCRRPH